MEDIPGEAELKAAQLLLGAELARQDPAAEGNVEVTSSSWATKAGAEA